VLTVKQFAIARRFTRQWVNFLLKNKRIPGAKRYGGNGRASFWLIPDNAKVKPK
jgi:hypothetical protein